MGKSAEYISYNCVLQLFPGTPESGGITGEVLSLFLQKGSNGGGANFSSHLHRAVLSNCFWPGGHFTKTWKLAGHFQ